MSHVGKGKKMVPLQKRKDVANTARMTMSREAEDSVSAMTKMEEDYRQRGCILHNTLRCEISISNHVKSVLKKLRCKDKGRKRASACPVLGAVLKFHNDDDVDGDIDDDVDPAADVVRAA